MSDQIIVKKKKVHGGHAHHGGSWKVAYADFVTAMMAFFMVMWIMGLSDDTKAQIQGYFNDPMGFNKTLPRSKQVITVRGVPAMRPGTSREPQGERFAEDQTKLRKLENKIKAALSKDQSLKGLLKQLELSLTREGLRIEFVESGHVAFFESGSSKLKPVAIKMINAIAPALSNSDRKMMVEGHTDATPYPSEEYTNWDLSSDRAQAMRLALSRGGVKLDQFKAVRGLADTELRKPSEPRSPVNRRVSILLPFKSEKELQRPSRTEFSPPPPDIFPDYAPPAGGGGGGGGGHGGGGH